MTSSSSTMTDPPSERARRLAPRALERRLLPEEMDALDLPMSDYEQALAGLRRINRVSRTAPAIASPIIRYLQRTGRKGPIKMLDVAAGGADVSLDLARLLLRRGWSIDLTLCDRNGAMLKLAESQAASNRQAVTTIACDATTELPSGRFDVVISTLFLHHLTFEEAVRVVTNMRSACTGMMVISDLRRSHAGLLMAKLGCHALSRSRLVHIDGPQSVRAAWTVPELSQIATAAGLHNARVSSSWPWRQMLTWEAHV